MGRLSQRIQILLTLGIGICLSACTQRETDTMSLIWSVTADSQASLPGTAETAEFSPEDRFVASGTGDGKVRLWRVSNGALVWESVYWEGSLENKQGEVEAIAFSPDGELIAAAGNEGGIKIYNAHNGSLIKTMGSRSADSIAFSHNGQYLAAPNEGRVRMYDPSDWSLHYDDDKIHHSCDVNSISFTSDDKFVLTGSCDRTVKISRVSNGRLVRTVQAAERPGSVKSVRVSPDGTLFATGNGEEYVVKVFRVEDGSLVTELPQGNDYVEAVAFSPDGRYLATGGVTRAENPAEEDTSLRIYRTSDFSLVEQVILQDDEGLEYLDFSSSSQYLLTAGGDGTLKLWQLEG
jgi:WD40 repeat protein